MKKNVALSALAVVAAALAIGGCSSGSSSPAPSTPTASPSPSPTPSPTPGPVQLAYTTTFGASSAATAAPAALAFPAPTLTAALTATETGFTGSFAAVSSCAQVTVTPATSTTGAFTLKAADKVATGCSVTVTGAVGFPTATVASTVATPGGVQLRWYLPNYASLSAPQPISASPINITGVGSLFATVLAISEQNYVGGFPAPTTTGAGCANIALVAAAAPPSPLPSAPPISTGIAESLAYYTVTATGPVATGACTISASDNYVPLSGAANPAATIGVTVTSGTGTFQ